MSARALVVDSPAVARARVPLALACLVIALDVVHLFVVWGVVFPSGLLDPVERATAGLVSGTAIVSATEIAIILALAWRWALAPRDLGLSRDELRRAIGPALAIWLGAQAVTLFGGLSTGTLALGAAWHAPLTSVAGDFLAQIAASALSEELLFRSILLVAVVHAVGRRGAGVAAGIAVSTLVFVVSHFPRHVAVGLDAVEWAEATIGHVGMGVFFGLTFLVTGNLWLTTAIHALGNMRLSLVLAPTPFENWSVTVAALAYLVIASVRTSAPEGPRASTPPEAAPG